jgi:hypothetical protein
MVQKMARKQQRSCVEKRAWREQKFKKKIAILLEKSWEKSDLGRN